MFGADAILNLFLNKWRLDVSLRDSKTDTVLHSVYGLDQLANCCLGLEATSQAHNLAKADGFRHERSMRQAQPPHTAVQV